MYKFKCFVPFSENTRTCGDDKVAILRRAHVHRTVRIRKVRLLESSRLPPRSSKKFLKATHTNVWSVWAGGYEQATKRFRAMYTLTAVDPIRTCQFLASVPPKTLCIAEQYPVTALSRAAPELARNEEPILVLEV
jgi:hypothetical protein